MPPVFNELYCDPMGTDIISANCSQQVFNRLSLALIAKPPLGVFGYILQAVCTHLLELTIKSHMPNLDINGTLLIRFEVMPNFVAGCRCACDIEPVTRGMCIAVRQNLHNLPTLKLIIKRNHTRDHT